MIALGTTSRRLFLLGLVSGVSTQFAPRVFAQDNFGSIARAEIQSSVAVRNDGNLTFKLVPQDLITAFEELRDSFAPPAVLLPGYCLAVERDRARLVAMKQEPIEVYERTLKKRHNELNRQLGKLAKEAEANRISAWSDCGAFAESSIVFAATVLTTALATWLFPAAFTGALAAATLKVLIAQKIFLITTVTKSALKPSFVEFVGGSAADTREGDLFVDIGPVDFARDRLTNLNDLIAGHYKDLSVSAGGSKGLALRLSTSLGTLLSVLNFGIPLSNCVASGVSVVVSSEKIKEARQQIANLVEELISERAILQRHRDAHVERSIAVLDEFGRGGGCATGIQIRLP